jgi:hypothetical protein
VRTCHLPKELVPRLHAQGFAVIGDFLEAVELETLGHALREAGPLEDGRGGIRALMTRSHAIRQWAEKGRPSHLARDLLGERAQPVKATLFDKTAEANWKRSPSAWALDGPRTGRVKCGL